MKPKQKVSTLALSLAAALGLFVGGPFGGPPAARAMSADSSGYAVVLPWVVNSSAFNTVVSVENHSPGAVNLVLYYVGEPASDNPRRLTCSEQVATPALQTFSLKLAPDAVLEFDLKALLLQKCKGAVTTGSRGDRGTLTILASSSEQFRISAAARVERVQSRLGVMAFGYSQDGLPIGALEGSTQIVAGLRNGPDVRIDCLVGSFYDKSGSGNVYRLSVKDAAGALIGDTTLSLHPWSADMLIDVFAAVGAQGAAFDGVSVEIEPAANKTLPAMIASCQVIETSNPQLLATVFRVGKVFEPLDLLRRRRVSLLSTPGAGAFLFDPKALPPIHAVFLRAPDLVTCSVGSATGQLILRVTAPDGRFVAGGFSSTGEFYTGDRGSVAGGQGGAWGIEVDAAPGNPPSDRIPYTLSCVSGNGMSQLDFVSP